MLNQAAALRVFALVVLALAPARLSAQTAELVRDIDVAEQGVRFPPSSDPANLFSWQGKVFFSAIQTSSGIEPWVSDGTASGTRMLADICPGQCSSSPQFVAGVGGTVFFVAATEVDTEENALLWRSDGTRAGTFPLTGPALSIQISISTPAAVAGGRLFFLGCQVGCALWTSDGTPAGTGPVPALGEAEPELPLLAIGDRVYFVAGQQIWVSDGTVAGTAPVPGVPQTGSLTALFAATDRLFCVFPMESGATQLWVVTGGGTGARQVPVPASADLDRSFTTVGHHGYSSRRTPLRCPSSG